MGHRSMKHLRHLKPRSHSLTKRIPLNTIVLPPLSPTEPEVRLLVNKANGDLVALSRSPEVTVRNVEVKGSDGSRVAQLEQNIRFLQEQHQVMLTGLHKEIDNLKHKNRELQFQLVFVKGSVPSSPSSSEDDLKPKVYMSPNSPSVTPLQVELLEKELGELKLQMHEIESQNSYLSAIVDEQKKKLEKYELDLTRNREKPIDGDLFRKLEDTEALVRKLHRENSDLRRETASTSQQHRDYYPRDQPQRGKGGPRYRGGGNYKGNWFPPLHTQNYWSGGRGGADRGNSSGETSLPNLNGGQQGSSRRSSNNNHYRSGEGRKYRGGQNKGQKPS